MGRDPHAAGTKSRLETSRDPAAIAQWNKHCHSMKDLKTTSEEETTRKSNRCEPPLRAARSLSNTWVPTEKVPDRNHANHARSWSETYPQTEKAESSFLEDLALIHAHVGTHERYSHTCGTCIFKIVINHVSYCSILVSDWKWSCTGMLETSLFACHQQNLCVYHQQTRINCSG